MLQKRKHECVAFAVDITPDKRTKVQTPSVEIAVLAPFHARPKVCFEGVKLNTQATRNIILRNPNESSITVELTKLPDSSRGFNFSDTDFDVEKESEVMIIINWLPTSYGSWRDNVKIINKKTKKTLSEIILLSSTEEPPRVLRPLRNLRPQSKSNFQKSKTTMKAEGLINARPIVKKCSEDKENKSRISSVKSKPQNPLGKRDSATVTSKRVVNTPASPQTPRRDTYEVFAPVSVSRRSTYSLINTRVASYMDLEQEKLSFDKIASPDVFNESLEIAASKLASNEASAISTPMESSSKVPIATTSSTFIVPMVPELNEKCFTPSRRTTYQVLTPVMQVDLQRGRIENESVVKQNVDRYSLDSLAGSDKHYDSLEAEDRKSGDLLLDLDHFDFDKISDLSYDGTENQNKSDENIYCNDFQLTCSNLSQTQKGSNKSSITVDKNQTYIAEAFKPQVDEYIRTDRVDNTVSAVSERNVNNKPVIDLFVNQSPVVPSIINTIPQSASTKSKNLCNLQNIDEVFNQFDFSLVTSSLNNSEVLSETLPINLIYHPIPNDQNNSINRSFSQIISETGEHAAEKEVSSLLTDPNTLRLSSNFQANYIEGRKTEIKPEPKDCIDEFSKYCHSFDFPVKVEQCLSSIIKTEPIESLPLSGQSLVSLEINPNVRGSQDTVDVTEFTHSTSSGNIPLEQLKTELVWEISPPCKNVENKNKNMGAMTSNNSNREINQLFLLPTITVTKSKIRNIPNISQSSPPKIRKLASKVQLKHLVTPKMFAKPPTHKCQTDARKSNMKGSLPRPSASASLKKRKSPRVTDWLPVRRLRLSSKSSQCEEENLDTVPLCETQQLPYPNAYFASTTNPFDKGGMYFDDAWLQQQEQELIKWTNLMLQPPSELRADTDQSERGTLHRLNALRVAAFNILVSDNAATTLARVKIAVDKKIICVRTDRDLHADLGLQDTVITLLMSYNPVWLRLCLEAVYQCNIHLKRHSDSTELVNFIRKRVISDEFIQQTYPQTSMQHELADKMKKFTLFKFLTLVYLLDLVKCKKVIMHDPCLFRKTSKYKSSRDILVEFNKEFIAGSGDIIKSLRLRGYEVSFIQKYLHEFDFSLTDRSELRDGVRITRLAETLIGDNTLCERLRVPAISSLQKKHNADVAFSALKVSGYVLPADISPKDISDGHKEKTLSLLWHLRNVIQLRAVHLIIIQWRKTKLVREDRKAFLKKKRSVIKIQKWFRKKLHEKQLSPEDLIRAKEIRKDFLELKSAAITLQRQFRRSKENQKKEKQKNAIAIIQNWYQNKLLIRNARNEFRKKRNAAIVIQKAFRTYQAQKAILPERQSFIKLKIAVVTLQKKYRARFLSKLVRSEYLTLRSAALTIQRRYRARKLAATKRREFLHIRGKIIYIQRKYRAKHMSETERKKFLDLRSAALTIQKIYRARKLASTKRQDFLHLKVLAVNIQRKYRAKLMSRTERKRFLDVKSAALTIQRRYRAKKLGATKRQKFLHLKDLVINMQRKYRAKIMSRTERKKFLDVKSAALTIQRRYRAKKLGATKRQEFLHLMDFVIKIQRKYRAKLMSRTERKKFLDVKSAALTIQRRYRAKKLGATKRQEFLHIKDLGINIQRKYRAKLMSRTERKRFLNVKCAALTIQIKYRAKKLGATKRQEFLHIKDLVINIQRKYRAKLMSRTERKKFLDVKSAALTIQRRYRAKKLGATKRQEFLHLMDFVIKIQRKYRAKLMSRTERKKFLDVKSAALTIQRRYRAKKLGATKRQEFLQLMDFVIKIQRKYRAKLMSRTERKKFLDVKSAALTIQRRYRAKKLGANKRLQFLHLKSLVVIIQRKYRAEVMSRTERKRFLCVKSAALTLQRRYRAKKLGATKRQEFLHIKDLVINIQRKYRAKLMSRTERKEFVDVKSAALTIQRRYRAKKLGATKRQEFLHLMDFVIKIQRKYRAKLMSRTERKKFLDVKSAALTIQRRYRAKKLGATKRQEFLHIKDLIINIQRKYRAKLMSRTERKKFLDVTSAALTIQRRYRAKKLGATKRQEFLHIKDLVIRIQRKYRAKLMSRTEKKRFLEMKSAVLTIQRRYRAKKLGATNRQEFLHIKALVINIQRKYRAKLMSRTEKKRFLEVKIAALTIQRRYRAKKLGATKRQEFLHIKDLVINIQRKYRAKLVSRTERKRFLEVKSAALTIQRRYRAKKLGSTKRQDFLHLKDLVINIQRKYRAKLMSRTERKRFLEVKSAALTIQRRYRATKLASTTRQDFHHIKILIINIQTKYRAKLVSRTERKRFLDVKLAALTIQRRYRAKKLAATKRQEFLYMKAMIINIQRKYRAKLNARDECTRVLDLKSAALKIQNIDRLRHSIDLANHEEQQNQQLESAKLFEAAIKIQARWRGWRVRQAVKVPKPQQIKTIDKTMFNFPIVNRSRNICPIVREFRKLSISQLQMVLYNLDVVTKLSAEQCKYFVSNGTVKILYEMLNYTNKASGTNCCTELILLTLLNMYKAPETTTTVWKETLEVNGVFQLVELMMSFRQEKNTSVFCKAATLIWLFAQDPVKAQTMKTTPKVLDMMKYIKSKQLTTLSSKKIKRTPSKKVPAVQPNWGNYFNHLRAFDNKDFALLSVLQVLQC